MTVVEVLHGDADPSGGSIPGHTGSGLTFAKVTGWTADGAQTGVTVDSDGLRVTADPGADEYPRMSFHAGSIAGPDTAQCLLIRRGSSLYGYHGLAGDPGDPEHPTAAGNSGLDATFVLLDDPYWAWEIGDKVELWVAPRPGETGDVIVSGQLRLSGYTVDAVTPTDGTQARPSMGRMVAPRPGGGTVTAIAVDLSGLQWNAGTVDAFVVPADATLTGIELVTVNPTGNPSTDVYVGEVTGANGSGNPTISADVTATGDFTGFAQAVSVAYPEGAVLAVGADANFGACDALVIKLTFSTGIAAVMPMWVQFAT